MKPASLKTNTLFAVLLTSGINLFAQTVPLDPYAPTVQWRNTSWNYYGSTGNYIPQKSFQEDWWYDHCNAYQTPPRGGTFNGYISSGYSHLQETYDETTNFNATYGRGCTNDQWVAGPNSGYNCGEWQGPGIEDEGPTVATFGLVDPKGKTVWNKFTNFNGYYNRVKQLSDGNFLAVGTSNSTRKSMASPFNGSPLYFNPHTGNTTDYFIYNNVFTGSYSAQKNQNHIDVVKFDVNGNIIFNYIYGPYDFNGTASLGSPALSGNSLAYEGGGEAFDLIEEPGGNIIVVGNAEDYSLNQPYQYYRAFIMKLDPNGLVLNKAFLVNPNPPNLINAQQPDHLSVCRGVEVVTIGGQTYYAVVFQDDEANFGKAVIYVELLSQNLTNVNGFYLSTSSTTLQWFQQIQTPLANVNCWDLAVNSQNEIIVPALVNCNNCKFAADNVAELRMYRLDPAHAGAFLNTPPIFQNVEAFDLKARLTNLSTGGFGVVSVVKPAQWGTQYSCSVSQRPGWLCDYDAGYWNTNPYVAKMDDIGNKIWETNFDTDDPLSCNFPTETPVRQAGDDVKRQECTYGVSEGPDGSLVVSGNNSNNMDDNYLVKLNSDCQTSLTYDINGPVSITGSQTWVGNQTVIGMITVASGGTLTIAGGTIQFADTKLTGVPTGITVMPGGKLVVVGATLTNITSCPNGMWDGILVEGNPSLSQTFANQGVVFLQGNCNINNARTGVSIGRDSYGDGGGWAIGLVANFLNNNVDVHMAPYAAPLVSGNEPFNKTSFSNCNFRSDNYLNDPSYVDVFGNQRTTSNHVELNGVKGIALNKPGFKTYLGVNLPSNYRSDDRTIGIYSTDATFFVSNNGIFENLRYGVYAQSTNPLKTFSIDKNTFKNCYSSLYESGINYSTVTSNTFVLTNSLPTIASKGCAINPNSLNCISYFHYLNQCNGFTHQFNQFTGNGFKVFGTIFNNTSTSASITNYNTYTGCYRSNQTQSGNSGLQISCNQSSLVTNIDLAIASTASMPSQGACSGLPTTPANNTFSHFSSALNSDINSLSSFIYNYNPNVASMVPLYSNLPPFDKVGCAGLFNVPFTVACPPPPPGCGIGCRIAQAFTDAGIAFNLSLQLRLGNGADLYAAINSNMSDGNLKNLLISRSPYLSDGVLIAYLQRTITPSPGNIKNVIIANSPVTQAVMAVINTLNLPHGIQNQINSAQTGVSQRQELQDQVNYYLNQKQFNIDGAITLLLNDTIIPNKDTIIARLLKFDNTVKGKTDLVNLFVGNGDYTSAQPYIDSIKAMPGLLKKGTFLQHHKDLSQSGKTWAQINIDASLRNDIVALAMDSLSDGFGNARSVLGMVNNVANYEVIEDVGTSNNSRIGSGENEVQNTTVLESAGKDLVFKAFPNPFKNELNVLVAMPENTTEAQVQLIEPATGRIIFEKAIVSKQSNTTFNTSELGAGLYLICVKGQNITPQFIKVINLK